MNMTSEYEDLRVFQNNELETLLSAKRKKEPEFQRAIEEAKVNMNRPQSRHPPRPVRRDSATSIPLRRDSTSSIPLRRDSATSTPANQSPIAQHSMSPMLTQSPGDIPDLNALKNETSLPPFIKFFLHLPVVQQNWSILYHSWPQYTSIFQRHLMTEKAFAKAILEDAVRTPNPVKFEVQSEHVEMIRDATKNIPPTMPFTKVISEVVLEMAEAGDIEFTDAIIELREHTFGPKIISEVATLETSLNAQIEPVSEKAKDPRQRI
jgi:hypothetical protein